LLLLIGDQIYADGPSRAAIRAHGWLRGGAGNFAEFASLYEFAWTRDARVRQLLAMLPTFMICDDHEITNGWNTTPFWRAKELKRGNEQMLVDGLVAYWVYQAWGNLLPSIETDSRLQIMQDAAARGEDALEPLRDCMSRAVRGETRLRWHYSIPTSPPVFVCDARADREARLEQPAIHEQENSIKESRGAEKQSRIMSRAQMEELRTWLRANDSQLGVLISSVPMLLPPLIGLCEYTFGKRLSMPETAPAQRVARLIGRMQLSIAERAQFDHWPVYADTWHELADRLTERRHDILALSGDVHFSYFAEASPAKYIYEKITSARLFQFVCSPFENRLGPNSRRKIIAQTRWKRASYGGLRARMNTICEVANNSSDKQQNKTLFIGNSVAVVTFHSRQNGACRVDGLHSRNFMLLARCSFLSR
jgi:phosphodiesterase/alkaline phosphatase D-like protein